MSNSKTHLAFFNGTEFLAPNGNVSSILNASIYSWDPAVDKNILYSYAGVDSSKWSIIDIGTNFIEHISDAKNWVFINPKHQFGPIKIMILSSLYGFVTFDEDGEPIFNGFSLENSTNSFEDHSNLTDKYSFEVTSLEMVNQLYKKAANPKFRKTYDPEHTVILISTIK